MKSLFKWQRESVIHIKKRELMVLSSIVEGLKILQVKGLPTKAQLMKQKRSTRTPYQACNHETAISSQHSPSSSPPVSPQRKAKKRGYADHGV